MDADRKNFHFKGYEIVNADGSPFCTHHGISWFDCGRKSVALIEGALYRAEGELVQVAEVGSGLAAEREAMMGTKR